MKDSVRQSSTFSPDAAPAVTSPPLSSWSLCEDDASPTRVTPSMSSSEAMKPATASWSGPQPTISRAGPGTVERAWISAPSSSCTAGLAVPVSFSSQTLLGMTRASSFSTRSQSKRLWARLASVVVRLC